MIFSADSKKLPIFLVCVPGRVSPVPQRVRVVILHGAPVPLPSPPAFLALGHRQTRHDAPRVVFVRDTEIVKNHCRREDVKISGLELVNCDVLYGIVHVHSQWRFSHYMNVTYLLP